MTTSLTVVRGRGAAALASAGALVLSLLTGTAGAVGPTPTGVSRGNFALLSSAPLGTVLTGRAQVVRVPSLRTILTVHFSGLTPGATYGVHLHIGLCSGGAGHYQNGTGPAAPPNELWASSNPANAQAGVKANIAGNAAGRGDAPWIANPIARSVVIHAAGGTKLACADLT